MNNLKETAWIAYSSLRI